MIRRLGRLVPASLAGRTTLLLITSLLILHVGSVWVHEASLRGSDEAMRERVLAEGLAQAVRALASIPQEQRDASARDLSTPSLDLHWSTNVRLPDARARDRELDGLRDRLAAAPELTPVRLAWGDDEGHTIVGVLPLAQGGVVSFTTRGFHGAHGAFFDLPGSASLVAVALVVGLVSLVVVRGLTRPLRVLSDAADRIGRDSAPVPVAENGPSEVRDAARAFNAMQDRIRELLEDRLQALAAVGHDLRTPLARLRLRAGFLEEADLRDRFDADLDEMERMVEATLSYLREGREHEDARSADLVAMVRTLCDGVVDDGAMIAVEAPASLVLPLRRTAVRRALCNLIENAATHGGGDLMVTVAASGDGAAVEVADRGPGIPEADLVRVLDPFVRLDPSRNRETGGIGLGLAIARRAVEGAGGTLCLANREGGGLVARVTLPGAGASPRRGGILRPG